MFSEPPEYEALICGSCEKKLKVACELQEQIRKVDSCYFEHKRQVMKQKKQEEEFIGPEDTAALIVESYSSDESESVTYAEEREDTGNEAGSDEDEEEFIDVDGSGRSSEVQTAKPPGFSCSICSETFASLYLAMQHIQSNHAITVQNVFTTSLIARNTTNETVNTSESSNWQIAN